MTLVERLINEHNQVVQYAKESPEKDGFLSGVKKAIDIVKNHNDWISVDDELPEPEIDCSRKFKPTKFYLIQLKSGLIDIVAFVNIYYDAGDNRDEFVVCTINSENNKYVVQEYGQWQYDINEVKYWQPLPQPPKE